MENYTRSTRELLFNLIGIKATRKLYKGDLRPLMIGEGNIEPHPKLAMAFELARRMLEEKLRRGPPLISSRVTTDYLTAHFLDKDHESFVVIFLDNQHRVLQIEELFKGTIDGALVYPREVVKTALKFSAAACIFAHNHPSGVPEPSKADESLTRRLKNALALVDIRTLDHIVVGGEMTVSFAERGLL